MGLAAAVITPSDFQQIQTHLATHKPPYRCMHMRETRKAGSVLRYLHAMHAPLSASNVIEGKISGPGVFWHYELIGSRTQTQLNVRVEKGPAEERQRIGEHFLPEILDRIAEEQAGAHPHPKYLAGRFYLRRKSGGVAPSHAACQEAIKQGALDPRFVASLSAWDLTLLYR